MKKKIELKSKKIEKEKIDRINKNKFSPVLTVKNQIKPVDKKLCLIKEKVYSNKRIDTDDALYLYGSNDIIAIGEMASHRLKNSTLFYNEVYYSHNINVNPTNICELRCNLCAFSKDFGAEGAYARSADEMIDEICAAYEACGDGYIEIHIVGGLTPVYNLDFYENFLRRIKKCGTKITIQAFTAVEIDYLASNARISIEETLVRLKSAGLDAVAGGGAEIFNDAVRSIICEKKIKSAVWLDIMKKAHELGIPSNVTMLYGHIETDADRVEHLRKIRELQDETGGFKSFVPLAFFGEKTAVRNTRYNSGFDDLKNIAIGRIFLDNFLSVKALHNMLGLKFAQAALYFGANDLGGTSFKERIARAAGAFSVEVIGEDDLIKIIKNAGKTAVKTDSTYKLKIMKEIK